MKRLENIKNKCIPVSFFIGLLALWEWVVRSGLVDAFTLPKPTDIAKTLIEILPALREHMIVTLQEALTGFGIAIGFAILLALLMDNIKVIKKALYPLIVVSQTIPIIALAPLFAMWFGYDKLPKIIVVVLVCFFPIVVSLLHGLESVDNDMLNLLKSMGANQFQIFRLVKFPAALVNFFSGLRIAATYSIMGAVIGEWLGGKAGLGIYMMRIKHSYAYDKFFAVIVIIVILSMLLFKFIDLVQYIMMPWARVMKNEE